MAAELDDDDHQDHDHEKTDDDSSTVSANLQIIHFHGQFMDLLVI
jgi:hypothetical protein